MELKEYIELIKDWDILMLKMEESFLKHKNSVEKLFVVQTMIQKLEEENEKGN